MVAVTGDEMATITATQRVVNNHLTNFNYHHLSSVIKYLNNQQQQHPQPQQPKTWTTTNALSISQRYFEKIAPASVGMPALMNQNFYDMQVYNFKLIIYLIYFKRTFLKKY